MKKIMKFAAMMAAAIAICVSCDGLGNIDQDGINDGNENVDGGNTGNENDGEQEGADVTEPISIDGKQFTFEFTYGGIAPATGVLDLGVNEEGFAMILANIPLMGMGAEDYTPMFMGSYTVTADDATSGSISIVDPSDPSASALVITYSDLSETTMSISCSGRELLSLDNVTATLREENIIVDLNGGSE